MEWTRFTCANTCYFLSYLGKWEIDGIGKRTSLEQDILENLSLRIWLTMLTKGSLNKLSSVSKEAAEQNLERKDVRADKKWRVRSYDKVQDDTVNKDRCVMRGACHDLDDCSLLLSQTIKDRVKVLFINTNSVIVAIWTYIKRS